MKALKILGFIVGALGLAVLVFWIGWLRPPAAEDVCANVVRVAEKEAGVAPPASMLEECVASASQPPKYGRMPWVKRLKCMRDAETSAEIKACNDR